MIKRICFFGGPGCGKSALSSWLSAMLKMNKIETEHINEYVKSWAFIGRSPVAMDQAYIYCKQMYKEDIVLRNSRDVVVVSESPLFLSLCYAKKSAAPGWQHLVKLAQEFDETYPSLNIVVRREELPYKTVGRFQKHNEALALDSFITESLCDWGVPYCETRYDDLIGILSMTSTALDKNIVIPTVHMGPEVEPALSSKATPMEESKASQAQSYILLDFWAEWCGPCKMLKPVISEIAAERDNLEVQTVDISAEQEAAEKYGIKTIPQLVLLRDGEEVSRRTGYAVKQQIDSWLDQSLQ